MSVHEALQFPQVLKESVDTCSFPAPRKEGQEEGKEEGKEEGRKGGRKGGRKNGRDLGGRERETENEHRLKKGEKEDQQTEGQESCFVSEHRVAAEVFGL